MSSVYFDHGDSRRSDVAATKGFFGETVSNQNRLTDIDIMIANRNGEVELLIEIEERDVSPKKILGDVLATILCNRFAVRCNGVQRYFRPTPTTRLLIVGTVPARGTRLKKVERVIAPQIHRLHGLPNNVTPQHVELIFACDIESAIAKLKDRVRVLLL